MRQIALVNSSDVCLVSDEDYERLLVHRWHVDKYGYARRSNGNSRHLHMHRDVLPTLPGFLSDHINRNRLDNRRENLRHVTPGQSVHNRFLPRGVSGFVGVRQRGNRWQAYIISEGKQKHLGMFGTAWDAAMAYDAAAVELYGDYPVLNFSAKLARQHNVTG